MGNLTTQIVLPISNLINQLLIGYKEPTHFTSIFYSAHIIEQVDLLTGHVKNHSNLD